MIWAIACVAVYAHSGDFADPVTTVCSDAPIAMSDTFLDAECKNVYSCEVTEINPEWSNHKVCPNEVSSHPIAWVTTLEITLKE